MKGIVIIVGLNYVMYGNIILSIYTCNTVFVAKILSGKGHEHSKLTFGKLILLNSSNKVLLLFKLHNFLY